MPAETPTHREHVPGPHGPLTPDQVMRWARLIAAGADEFPLDLPPADQQRLAGAVRGLLRERLMDLVADAIARDLVRARRDTEVPK